MIQILWKGHLKYGIILLKSQASKNKNLFQNLGKDFDCYINMELNKFFCTLRCIDQYKNKHFWILCCLCKGGNVVERYEKYIYDTLRH